MIVWVRRIGWCTAVLGALLISPLADLFPVDLWLQLWRLFHAGPQGESHAHLRAIGASQAVLDPFQVAGAALIALGLLLLFLGYQRRCQESA
jgi:hypothetical protein